MTPVSCSADLALAKKISISARTRGPDPAGAGKLDIYAAMGFRGQYIFIVPEHDMVVAVTGGTRAYRDERRAIDYLYTHILPSVRRK